MATVAERLIEQINVRFAAYCHAHALTIIASGVDNHGGLQWQAGKISDLNRFITLGFVLDDNDIPRWFEVSVGADDGTRFERVVVLEFDVPKNKMSINPEFTEWQAELGKSNTAIAAHAAFYDLVESLKSVLAESWAFGEWALRPETLREVYLMPRMAQR